MEGVGIEGRDKRVLTLPTTDKLTRTKVGTACTAAAAADLRLLA